jgi:hypothetical protein
MLNKRDSIWRKIKLAIAQALGMTFHLFTFIPAQQKEYNTGTAK